MGSAYNNVQEEKTLRIGWKVAEITINCTFRRFAKSNSLHTMMYK